ncbi:thioester domain-containing protein [Actinoplanes sp. TRM 88003]|uniref:Thioester domain-containing protein n=1 Tax=Paractinoplanes aksuensis TaxID=2939490 RepID=A0ABT1DTE4_9ACTN|nr:thioester domain-containing protein [Actinoplanes aksuensis]MCO8274119.1 thioester domain-containing protein [Actinoplanes aksuensis]
MRLVPALLAGAGLGLGAATPASAADAEPLAAVAKADGTARTLLLGGTPTTVRGIQLKGEGAPAVPAFSLSFSRTALTGEVDYSDITWAEAGNRNLSSAQWVIEQGYPSVNRGTLIAAAGVKVPPGASAATVNQLLRLGTQAAIWKRTDNVSLGAWRAGAGLGAENEYAVVKKVYDYLTRRQESLGEPQRTVTFEEPGYVDAPELIVRGPGRMALTVENGYAITDFRYSGGTWLITEVYGGGGIAFVRSIDPEQTTKVTATADHAVVPGVVFRGEGGPLLTPAEPYGDKVSGTFEKKYAKWNGPIPTPSPAPGTTTPPTTAPTSSPAEPSASPTGRVGGDGGEGGGLPVTGAPTGVVLAGAVALLVLGAGTVLLVRRRRLRFTA